MPSRINHIKIVTPNPQIVDAFLREVCDVPEGWPLGQQGGLAPLAPDAPLGPGGSLTPDDVFSRRHATETHGFIAGDANSRQFQILQGGDAGHVWAICISSRYIEDIYARAQARGVPCNPITVADWNEHDNIRNFFCIVDGIMFEIIRVEPKNAA